MKKINTDRVGVFTEKGLSPQMWFTPSSDFKISELYPDAIRAISTYHDGPNVIRLDIPLDLSIKFKSSGGSGSITGERYNTLQY